MTFQEKQRQIDEANARAAEEKRRQEEADQRRQAEEEERRKELEGEKAAAAAAAEGKPEEERKEEEKAVEKAVETATQALAKADETVSFIFAVERVLPAPFDVDKKESGCGVCMECRFTCSRRRKVRIYTTRWPI